MLARKTRRKIRNRVVGLAGAHLLRLWRGTIRVRISGLHRGPRGPLPERSGIVVLWHHELFLAAGVFRDPAIHVLIRAPPAVA